MSDVTFGGMPVIWDSDLETARDDVVYAIKDPATMTRDELRLLTALCEASNG